VNHRLLPALSILTAPAIPPSLLCENRSLQHNLVSDYPTLTGVGPFSAMQHSSYYAAVGALAMCGSELPLPA